MHHNHLNVDRSLTTILRSASSPTCTMCGIIYNADKYVTLSWHGEDPSHPRVKTDTTTRLLSGCPNVDCPRHNDTAWEKYCSDYRLGMGWLYRDLEGWVDPDSDDDEEFSCNPHAWREALIEDYSVIVCADCPAYRAPMRIT